MGFETIGGIEKIVTYMQSRSQFLGVSGVATPLGMKWKIKTLFKVKLRGEMGLKIFF